MKALLPVVDSFELARSQLQPSNAGEDKIDKAYQVLGPLSAPAARIWGLGACTRAHVHTNCSCLHAMHVICQVSAGSSAGYSQANALRCEPLLSMLFAVQGVYKQLVEAFRGLGVQSVPGEGASFDPEVHDAIMREEDDSVADGTVLQVRLTCSSKIGVNAAREQSTRGLLAISSTWFTCYTGVFVRPAG